MMECEEFTDRVTDYLDGRVPYGERIGMWLHSVMCVHCRRYLEQMRQVVDLMGEIDEVDADEGCPDEVKDDLLEKFRTETTD